MDNLWGWKQVVEYACRSGGKSDEAVAVDGGSRSAAVVAAVRVVVVVVKVVLVQS